MAFITYDTISNYLPVGHNEMMITRQLRMIESMFNNRQLFFQADATKTLKLYVTNEVGGNNLFYYRFIKSVTSVTAKDLFDSSKSEVLTVHDDYTLLPPSDTFSAGVELRCKLYYPCYLEVVASVGFLENVPENSDIEDTVIDYLIAYSNLQKEGGKHITQSKTGDDSEIAYDASSMRKAMHTPYESPELINLINKYATC
jgi:hypothetical protein